MPSKCVITDTVTRSQEEEEDNWKKLVSLLVRSSREHRRGRGGAGNMRLANFA